MTDASLFWCPWCKRKDAGSECKACQRPTYPLRTFDSWNLYGFRICKGQRSVSRDNDGKTLFYSTQVYSVRPPERSYGRDSYARRECPDWNGDGGFWGDWCDANDANY